MTHLTVDQYHCLANFWRRLYIPCSGNICYTIPPSLTVSGVSRNISPLQLSLLFTTQEWLKFLDRKQEVICTICVYFDYKKAFDHVPHRKLMDRLSKVGFHPLILSWLSSYLSNRQQFVSVNGESSQPNNKIKV